MSKLDRLRQKRELGGVADSSSGLAARLEQNEKSKLSFSKGTKADAYEDRVTGGDKTSMLVRLDVKNKLDEIAKYYGISQAEVVKMIVEDE